MNKNPSRKGTYHPTILVKNWFFLVGFLFVAFIIGFITIDTKIYEFLDDIIIKKIFLDVSIMIGCIVMFGCNLLIVHSFLEPKYVLKRQSWAASGVIVPLFLITSLLGFWIHLHLYNAIYYPQLHISLISLLFTILFSLPIFSTIYGIASSINSIVDYLPLHRWIIVFLDKIEEISSQPTSTVLTNSNFYLDELIDSAEKVIESIEKNLPYENYEYAIFLESSFHIPMKKLLKFFRSPEVSSAPEYFDWLANETSYSINIKQEREIYFTLKSLFRKK